jgi:hypothetical protein
MSVPFSCGSRAESSSLPRWLLWFFCFALALAGALRFTWLADMEYKGDEEWMFEHAMRIPHQEPWPELGMASGVGLRNPGLSVSVFAVLAKLVAAEGPLDLCWGVVVCNALAYVLLFGLAFRLRPKEQRETWLWALALSAVSPLAVLLQRKIWAQSILPLFCVLFLCGWLRRGRYWGAILWGFIGALLGQIHMSGFFFAAGYFLGDITLGRLRLNQPKTKWLGWFIGSVAGALPLIPWLRYTLTTSDRQHSNWLENVLSLRFYRYLFSDSLGLGLDYSLGDQYLDFLRYPLVLTKDLYPSLYLHGMAFSLGLYLVFCVARSLWTRRFQTAICGRTALSELSEEAFTLLCAFVGYGLLLTLGGVDIQRHYLVVTFPLEWMLLAVLARRFVPRARSFLLELWVVELLLSLTFLHYIHENHGALNGDYGKGYRWNSELGHRP